MSVSVRTREKRFKAFGDHQKFLQRIKKTLYYGSLPSIECLSLPVTELAADLFSQPQYGHSLDRLQYNDAAKVSWNACVSPCSLVLAMLYLERLKLANPEYVQHTTPSELFLVSLMISGKFLYDDGEEDEVFMTEWAKSGGITRERLVQLEKEFLSAIQWEVYVKDSTFWEKLIELEKTVAKREGCNRGWFTYTELRQLITTIDVNTFFQYVASLAAILIVTYTIGLLTIVGAMYVVSHMPGNCLTRSISESNTGDIENETTIPLVKPSPRTIGKPLDAADVLKTGILLASITTTVPSNNHTFLEGENSSVEFISWDWWNSPSLMWLSKTSEFVETLSYVSDFKCFVYDRYHEKCIANCKVLDLEDQVHKATKIRIQDQIERSWHKEWTDMFKNMIFRRETLTEFI